MCDTANDTVTRFTNLAQEVVDTIAALDLNKVRDEMLPDLFARFLLNLFDCKTKEEVDQVLKDYAIV